MMSSRESQHVEILGVIFAAVAVIKGVPRDRFEAWAREEGIDGLSTEDVTDYFDWVENMVEVDFRMMEDHGLEDDDAPA